MPSFEALSPRQREVLELLARGLSNDDIGGVLGVATSTVRAHVSQLLLVLEVDNRTEAAALYTAWSRGAARADAVLARPAIAVLPVTTLDGDARLRTIAAGLTYDLAALFARWCWFPVIFERRATGDDELCRRGATFAIHGVVRRTPRGLRLDVRIDDVPTGACLWTDTHELAEEELFDTEDTVVSGVVAAAYPVLVAHALAEVRRFPGGRPDDLSAWERTHLAMTLQQAREARANAEARAAFGAALERDPRLVLAHFGLGLASYDEVLNQWGERDRGLDRLRGSAERCVALAPHAAEGYFLLARHHQAHADVPPMIDLLASAVGHNPSFAPAHALLAQALALAGRHDEGLACARRAVQLSPRSQVAGLSVVYFICGRYPEALAAAERAVVTNPGYPFAHAMAAASAHFGGDRAEAERHHRLFRRLAPTFAPAQLRSGFGVGIASIDRLAQALELLDRRA
ncbi:MAG TPA: LuxR C-terminal-related transcriptional regulator [Kofleriaceae bacterium]|nr:LuxR C-terminal-related transcriptional regulator [Kofleriaceae bacterium]